MNREKRCPNPACGFANAFGNALCVKCGEDLIAIEAEFIWEETYKNEPHNRNYLFESIFNLTFFVCEGTALVLVVLGIGLLINGASLAPLFLVASVALAGLPFASDDPVGKAFWRYLETRQEAKKISPPDV